jgi:hypothetical protein
MIDSFNVQSARIHAQQNNLEAWVYTYLVARPWANHGLSDGLKKERRWWRGPFEVPLEDVIRCCGPETEMEYHIDPAWWEKRTTDLAASFTKLENIPPLIVEYRAGLLSIRDGNHRHEAIRRKGWQTCWIIVWYNSQADYEADAERWQKVEP